MSKIKVCVLRAGGTNCDLETKRAIDDFDEAEGEVVRINKVGKDRELQKYDALVIPGGFSYGDHIRAGVVFAKEVTTRLSDELHRFVEEDKPVLGICNGFQVLIETGLLPGFEGISQLPKAALAINESAKYECRWINLRNENQGNCIFTERLIDGEKLSMPVGHMEGRFIFRGEEEKEKLKKLQKNDQLVFRYSDENGNPAEGKYPENPNGAFHDIAGICSPSGKILGLMPHPERAFHGFQLPSWTRRKSMPEYGDGKLIFESLIDYLKRNFS